MELSMESKAKNPPKITPQCTALSCSSAKSMMHNLHWRSMLPNSILKKQDIPYEYQDRSAELPATLWTGSSGFAALMDLSCTTISLVGEICRWNKTSFAWSHWIGLERDSIAGNIWTGENIAGESSNLISIALVLLRGPASQIYSWNSKPIINAINSLQLLAILVKIHRHKLTSFPIRLNSLLKPAIRCHQS